MPRAFLAVLLTGVLLLPGDLARAQQPPPPPPSKQERPGTTVTVEIVNLLATVVNRRGKFVTDLSKEEFRISEDGKPQDIAFFSRETDLPLRIGLLLDTSTSIRDRLEFEKDAAVEFLANTVRRNKDMAFLMSFDNEADLLQGFTEDLNTLMEVIRKQRAGGGTALYRGVYSACAQHLVDPPLPKGEAKEVRRILVVISDGEDSDPGGPSRGQAIEACQRASVSLYAISTSTDWLSFSGTTPKKYHKTDGDSVLENFSEETGGRAFFPYRVDDLALSFQDIGQELRSQYSIAYTPTNRLADGRYRKIKVEAARKGLTVRTRKGYYAVRPTPAPRPTAAPAN